MGIKRIGVFGGAFDPPHQAHFLLAQAACDQLQLDSLHIIPTGQAGHKARPLTAATHRLAMARLAFAAIPNAVVDDRETLRAGNSYTVDTLRELHQEFPGAEIYLIMGEDQARALSTWHAWQEVVQLAIICVAARAHLAGAGTAFGAQLPPGLEFRRIDMPASDLSATQIRAQLATHQSANPLVFDSVARYIAHHHLYLTT
jgi:nicotinate-nucleotide adenylyltransferase